MNEDLNCKIWANLPDEVHTYFFRKIFAGDRGVKQELVIDFFTALHHHCIDLGIKSEWDIESGKRVRALVKNIKFNEPSRPTKPRRTTRSPSKSKAQPPVIGDVTGTISGASQETTLPRGVSSDPNSQT